MCAYVERFKKWAWGRGDSWRKGGKKSGLPLHSHFFLSPSRLIRLGNAFKPPKGINPLPPLKAKGSPSRTIGGGRKKRGPVETAFGHGVLHERAFVYLNLLKDGGGGISTFPFTSLSFSLRSICRSDQLFILLPCMPASRIN